MREPSSTARTRLDSPPRPYERPEPGTTRSLYLLLRFSNPKGTSLEARYRETQGLIRNSHPVQAMWLSRLGRMVASDVTESVPLAAP